MINKLDSFLEIINDDIYKCIRMKLLCLIYKKNKYKKIILNYEITNNNINISLSSYNFISNIKRVIYIYKKIFSNDNDNNRIFYKIKDNLYIKYKIYIIYECIIFYYKSDEKNFKIYSMYINDFMNNYYDYLSSLTKKRLELYLKNNKYYI